MSSPLACVIILVIILATVQADHEADLRETYAKLNCFKGYVGKFSDQLEATIKDCNSKSIASFWCYFSCCEAGMSVFVNGAFNDTARGEVLLSFFDPAAPEATPTVDQWVKMLQFVKMRKLRKG
ncbi:uncharacterized protein LOC110857400 [Folsomia candida]|uniref:uncharacterized protein LOC110857400 n=1 Tax=Folsomia candida TaxID=158441 RepID=UPI0016050061|nr:uncharacterized protein LOC110857400 [Folsomia candida]